MGDRVHVGQFMTEGGGPERRSSGLPPWHPCYPRTSTLGGLYFPSPRMKQGLTGTQILLGQQDGPEP